MANNFNFTEGSGAVGAADDISSVYYPFVKLVDATAESTTGIYVDVGAKANALRVAPANDITDATYIGDIKFGESLPAGTNAIGKLAANSGVDIGDVTLTAGTAAIGKLAANTGVDIGDVDVTSVIAGVGATNLGKARDSALGATDTGVMALAIRDDTLTTLTPADGDYAPLRVGSTGKLHVTDANITACNTGAVVISSGTVTTVSTVTNLSQLGGTAITMDEGVHDAGCQRVTIATDDDGVAHLATIAGDTTNIETAIQIIDDWDATHASAAPADGPQIMGAAYSTALPTDVGADADAARICTDRHGRILRGVMPQNFQATFTSADAQAATPVKAKTADRKMYILSLVVSVDTAMNVQFQDDIGPTVLIEGMYFAANGGAHLTWPLEAPLVVNTNEDFDVITSAAGNISVTITGYLAV